MESKKELENAKNEVLRKIGQNVILFQQLEKLLKFLIVNGKMAGYVGELKSKQEQRTETIYKKTMGQLVGDYIEGTFSDCEKIPEAPIAVIATFNVLGIAFANIIFY